MIGRRIPAGTVATGTEPGRAGATPARLPGTQLGQGGVAVGQPPLDRRLDLDPELAHHVAALVEAGRREGYERGVAEGEAAAFARSDALARALGLAVSEIEHALERNRVAAAGGVIDLAIAMAEAILGRTPHDGGAAVVRRITEALDQLDERPLTVRVCADDLDAVRATASTIEDLAVEVDPNLRPGEARISGGWSHADLTREAAWAAIERLIDEGEG